MGGWWGVGGGVRGVGADAVPYNTLLHMNRLSETKSLLFFMSSVFPRATFIDFIDFTAADVKYRVAVIKSLHLLSHSAVYIVIPTGIIGPILISSKIEFR